MTAARSLNAKLLLEGVDVPFIGATITHSVNQAAIAYIDMVPHQYINDIKPRTLVQLFVRDFTNQDQGSPFVLAFEGEVFGFSFGKTTTSRTFTISCIDFTSYWDNVLTYFFDAQKSLGKGCEEYAALGQSLKDVKAAGGVNNVTISSVSTFFIQILNKSLKENPGNMVAALAALVRRITEVNSFYSAAQDRLRINDRMLINYSGALIKLLKDDEALAWFTGMLGRATGWQTLRMVMQDLMGILFHDMVSIPFPAAVTSKIAGTSVLEGSNPKLTIGEFVFKPNLYMMPSPMCNVFFPDEYSSFQYNRNFFQEPTRLIYKPEMPSFNSNSSATALAHTYVPASFQYFMDKKSKRAYPPELVGTGDLQVSSKDNWGKMDDPDYLTGPDGQPVLNSNKAKQLRSSSNGKKKEQQFLTNEEKLKGILLSQETMVPASSQFRASLTQLGRENFSLLVAEYLFMKKRYENRAIQITSHLKMSVVPGFPVTVLDDSDAGQTVLAYCSSVTHRIYCNQGGYTNTTLSYARSAYEQDLSSGKAGEPLIPPWFLETLFGKKMPSPPKTGKKANKKVDSLVQARAAQNVYPDAISSFYAGLLGHKGCNSITTDQGQGTMFGAIQSLLDHYRAAKKVGPAAVQGLIDQKTRRNYVYMQNAMKWLGAKTQTTSMKTPFLEFYGERLSGGDATKFDSDQIKLRRDIVLKYRNVLKDRRGFRG